MGWAVSVIIIDMFESIRRTALYIGGAEAGYRIAALLTENPYLRMIGLGLGLATGQEINKRADRERGGVTVEEYQAAKRRDLEYRTDHAERYEAGKQSVVETLHRQN